MRIFAIGILLLFAVVFNLEHAVDAVSSSDGATHISSEGSVPLFATTSIDIDGTASVAITGSSSVQGLKPESANVSAHSVSSIRTGLDEAAAGPFRVKALRQRFPHYAAALQSAVNLTEIDDYWQSDASLRAPAGLLAVEAEAWLAMAQFVGAYQRRQRMMHL